jgi:hypothetical protein
VTGGPDVVVVGAGAAGVTAAIFAARAGRRVLVLETRPQPGAKIRVSGGGRCNVLPSRAAPEDFSTSGSPHAMRNILRSWPLDDVRAFFERDLGVALKVEETGKVFPVSDDAREVVGALLAAATRAGVELRGGTRVTALRRERDAPGFRIETAEGGELRARRVILATGGLSLPKTGSDGAGLAMARRLGHSVVPTHPALVPLLTGDARWRDLAGVAAEARLTAVRDGRVLEERAGSLLVTHRGFTGPAVLDVSRHFTEPGEAGTRLLVQWGGGEPGDWEAALRAGGRGSVGAVVRERVPRRLASLLVGDAGVDPERRVSELPRGERARLVETLERFPLPVSGDEGYRTAEVTAGGVPLDEVVTGTLESRIVTGLGLCGEMLDVVGRLGGYNFLWAWVSGRRAGEAGGGLTALPSSR